ASASNPAPTSGVAGSTRSLGRRPTARPGASRSPRCPGQSSLAARAGKFPERIGQKIPLHRQLANLLAKLANLLLPVVGDQGAAEYSRHILQRLRLPR